MRKKECHHAVEINSKKHTLFGLFNISDRIPFILYKCIYLKALKFAIFSVFLRHLFSDRL